MSAVWDSAQQRPQVAGALFDGRARGPCRSLAPAASQPDADGAIVEAEVLRIRDESNNAWGGRKIAHVMSAKARARAVEEHDHQILRRHGKLEQRADEHPGP